jgi:hypothetical protein
MPEVNLETPIEERRGTKCRMKGASLDRLRKVMPTMSRFVWEDDARGTTRSGKYTYVIIELENGTLVDGSKAHRNCLEEVEEVTTFLQACFDQHPKLEKALDDFARKLAKHRIQRSTELMTKIGRAIDKAVNQQLSCGLEATWIETDASNLPVVSDIEEDEIEEEN